MDPKTLRVTDDSNTSLLKNRNVFPQEFYIPEGSTEKQPVLDFDEPTHVYTDTRTGAVYKSVTTFLKAVFEEFNSKKVIDGILKKKEWKTDPTYKYYQMSAKEIDQLWKTNGKEASDFGTRLHLAIEYKLNGLPDVIPENDGQYKEYSYFLNFWKEYNLLEKICRTEFMIYSEEHRLAGSIDALLHNKEDDTYSIVDWKRCKEVETTAFRNKMCKFPVNNVLDCKFYHYALQLNTYRYILENAYHLKIRDMFLIVCHPENENYIRMDVPRMEKEIDVMFMLRKREIEKDYC